MTNSANPDQLTSSEANWSGSTMFADRAYLGSAGPRLKSDQRLKYLPKEIHVIGPEVNPTIN